MTKQRTHNRTRVCFFVGPSVRASELQEVWTGIDAEIELLPPVQQGDVLRLMDRMPDVIAIIDGYFFQVPAVLHKEILYAMERGARVLGAASLGALRAAELDVLGMEGIGTIYGMYKRGLIDGDDEVAVVHTDALSAFKPLSEALVNIRYNLQRASDRKLISLRTARAMIASAKRLPFTERSYGAILNAARLRGVSLDELAALRHFLRAEAVDLKRADGLALVQTVAKRVQGKQPWPAHPTVRAHRSKYLHTYHRDYVGSTAAGHYVPDMQVLSLQKLFSPSFPRALRRVSLRCLAVDEALHRGIAPDDPQRLVACFRRRRGLDSEHAYAAWLTERCVFPHELHEYLRERDLEAKVLALYQSRYPARDGRAALYTQIVAAAAARIGVAVQNMPLLAAAQPSIPWEHSLLRESKARGLFRAALEWAGPMLKWQSELTTRAPHLSLIVSHARLEEWAMALWGAEPPFEHAVLARGFASQHEWATVARMAYLAPKAMLPCIRRYAKQEA